MVDIYAYTPTTRCSHGDPSSTISVVCVHLLTRALCHNDIRVKCIKPEVPSTTSVLTSKTRPGLKCCFITKGNINFSLCFVCAHHQQIPPLLPRRPRPRPWPSRNLPPTTTACGCNAPVAGFRSCYCISRLALEMHTIRSNLDFVITLGPHYFRAPRRVGVRGAQFQSTVVIQTTGHIFPILSKLMSLSDKQGTLSNGELRFSHIGVLVSRLRDTCPIRRTLGGQCAATPGCQTRVRLYGW